MGCLKDSRPVWRYASGVGVPGDMFIDKGLWIK
jgi:hypothetical protein